MRLERQGIEGPVAIKLYVQTILGGKAGLVK
jgi:hypothetical protein